MIYSEPLEQIESSLSSEPVKTRASTQTSETLEKKKRKEKFNFLFLNEPNVKRVSSVCSEPL